jgi:hypothetical protein
MKRFKSSEQAQRFLSVFEPINALFSIAQASSVGNPLSSIAQQSFHLLNKTAALVA